jgi:hypothetical protein
MTVAGNRRHAGGMASSMSNLYKMERDAAMTNAACAITSLREVVAAIQSYSGGTAEALSPEMESAIVQAKVLLRESAGKRTSTRWVES